MKRTILTLAAAIMGCTMALAKDELKRPDTYNYMRGMEEYNNENYEEAIKCFRKEAQEHPENVGYANCWLAFAYMQQEETGLALSAANIAIKKMPSKDKEFLSSTHSIRAKAYLILEDTTAALKDLTQAIALAPTHKLMYERRAQLYFELGRYAEADRDYDKIIELDEGDVYGYMGKGRNLNMQKRYEEAIKMFDYVEKLDASYVGAYSFRAESYYKLGQYSKALDDVIMGLRINSDDKAFYYLSELAEVAYTEAIAKLRVRSIKEPNNYYWDYCMGVVNEKTKAYQKAITAYKSAFKKDASDLTANRISRCYEFLGDYDNAIAQLDIAIELDSTDRYYPLWKSGCQYDGGYAQEAIATVDALIAAHPEFYYAYDKRGWYKENTGDLEGALEDYEMYLAFNDLAVFEYLRRGRVLSKLGRKEEAEADFRKCIELDESDGNPGKNSYYSYFYLGEWDKCLELLGKDLEKEDESNCYEAACIYSLMNRKTEALEYLRKALEMGYTEFAHIRLDTDLDNIRQTAEFKDMIAEYESRLWAKIGKTTDSKTTDDNYTKTVVEVPFTKENGVCKVKCTINGLPLHFVFDTGASDVTLSSVEATFMLKNDYLKKQDFGGSQYYMTANGSISEGTNVTLKSINFGGLTLDNVKASVVNAQSAPLLLGQSVLGRLGKIEIDNEKRVLRITHREKK